MAWTFVPTAIAPLPAQPINAMVEGHWANDATAEVIPDRFFAADLTPDNLLRMAQSRLVAIKARDSALDALVQAFPLNAAIEIPEVKEPTPEELAANEFFALLAELNALQAQVEKGLRKPDDPELAAAQSAVKKELSEHPEYQKDPRFR